MSNKMQVLLQEMLRQRPDLKSNEMFQAVQNNDAKKGEQIAMNLCKSYGVTKEQAIAQAKQFFGIR